MMASLALIVQRNLRNGCCSSLQGLKALQFEVLFTSVASAPKLEDLNKVDTFLDHKRQFKIKSFGATKSECQSALQSTLRACWLTAQHEPDMHFVSREVGGNGFLRMRKISKNTLQIGRIQIWGIHFEEDVQHHHIISVDCNTNFAGILLQLQGCSGQNRMGVSPAARPGEHLDTSLAAESAPPCTDPMGARRGHFTQRQDAGEKTISSVTFCISKLIPNFLSVCLTSALALEGVI